MEKMPVLDPRPCPCSAKMTVSSRLHSNDCITPVLSVPSNTMVILGEVVVPSIGSVLPSPSTAVTIFVSAESG